MCVFENNKFESKRKKKFTNKLIYTLCTIILEVQKLGIFKEHIWNGKSKMWIRILKIEISSN
jgi:hypothetical protein